MCRIPSSVISKDDDRRHRNVCRGPANPHGQTIWVTEGVGLCHRRGGPIAVICPGDRVFFEPGEDHWHGSAPTRFMTHLALQEVDDQGSAVTWGAHVTDDEYGAAPAIDA